MGGWLTQRFVTQKRRIMRAATFYAFFITTSSACSDKV
jgi:hypothetical protein